MKTDLKFADCFSGVVSCQFSQISSLLCTGTHLTVKDWPDKGSTAFRKLHFAHISTDYKLHITQVTFSETITFIMLYDTSMLSSIANNEKTTCSHAAEEGYIFQISRILQPRFLSALCPGLRPSIRGFFVTIISAQCWILLPHYHAQNYAGIMCTALLATDGFNVAVLRAPDI